LIENFRILDLLKMEESSDKTGDATPHADDDSSLSFTPSSLQDPVSFGPLKNLDLLFLSTIFSLAFILVLVSGQNYGLSWDEAYYYAPSRSAARWLGDLFLLRNSPFTPGRIEESWGEIRELPSVVKLSLGVSHALFSRFLGSLSSLRLPSAVAFSLTLVMIYILMFKSFGRCSALLSVSAYALMPRIFGHAHIAASESITVFMYVLVLFCFLKGLNRPLWSLMLGLVFGLALNTKINCLFIPFILLPWAHLFHRSRYANNFFSMVFLSPLIMIVTWPWLWHDPFQRFLEYIAFFAAHQFTAVFYFGQKFNYGSTYAPWHYPFVLAFLTIPPVTLFFVFAGVGGALRFLRKKSLAILYLWGALFTLLLSASPSSPKYDGIRLFIPAFLFLSLLSGVGMAALHEILPSLLQTLFKLKFNSGKRGLGTCYSLFPLACIVLVLAGGIFSVGTSHPYCLSYFNIFIGGIRGAYEQGMETTYWGEAVNGRVLDVLNELPPYTRIKTLALHDEVFNVLQVWGKLRSDLQINEGDPPFDYHLLLVRKGFFARPEWCLYLSWPRFKVFDFKEVPLVMLFETGEKFEKVWPYQIPSGKEVMKK
jgi:hypothetical protein